MKLKISETLRLIPDSPGVYLYKDISEKIIYIGKAKSLKKRVSSYFRGNIKSLKTNLLVKHIDKIDYIITRTEKEAFILEHILIRKHKPKYNIELKDDKSNPFIKINTNREFPGILLTRSPGKKKPGIHLFGPFPAGIARDFIKYLEDTYSLKRCKKKVKNIKKACVYFDIGKCMGPCTGKISQEEYHSAIREVIEILKGKSSHIISLLESEMKNLSSNLEFEKAAILRDRIKNIKYIQLKQDMIIPGSNDYDIINFHKQDTFYSFDVFSFRKGKIWTKNNFIYDNLVSIPLPQLLEEFISRFYQLEYHSPPPLIYLPQLPHNRIELLSFLETISPGKVHFKVPKRGKFRRLLEMVQENAAVNLYKKVLQEHKVGLIILKDLLGLKNIPRIIECFDISNIGSFFPVASEVRFTDGYPDKENYRHFKIKTVSHQDDFKMILEVTQRRYSRLIKEGKKLPDLILIDGGPGQLNSARNGLKEIGLKDLTIISLAKKEEIIYTSGYRHPIILEKSSPALRLLQRIRNEAHRFAISYHKKLRKKSGMTSILDEIPGIGPKKKKLLIKKFKDIKGIASAKIEEIAEVRGINIELAQLIRQYLNSLLQQAQD